MKFHSWRLTGIGGHHARWTNHIFPKDFLHPDHFTSLCGIKFGGLNGENKSQEYCPLCREKLDEAEARQQAIEDERIAKLEIHRATTTNEIMSLIGSMSMDKVNRALALLKKL